MTSKSLSDLFSGPWTLYVCELCGEASAARVSAVMHGEIKHSGPKFRPVEVAPRRCECPRCEGTGDEPHNPGAQFGCLGCGGLGYLSRSDAVDEDTR